MNRFKLLADGSVVEALEYDLAQFRKAMEHESKERARHAALDAKRTQRKASLPKKPLSLKVRLAAYKRSKVKVFSQEQMRRSRIDWHSLVPSDVAISQIKYEIDATAFAMRQAKMTLDEIGARFGVSGHRVSQRCARHARSIHRGSPAERWMSMSEMPALRTVRDAAIYQSMIQSLSGKPRDWLYV